MQSHLVRRVHTRREEFRPLLQSTSHTILLVAQDKRSGVFVPCLSCFRSKPSANPVATTLDICFGSGHLFFPLPHSHLGPRKHRLSLGPRFFPLIPIACSQHRSRSESDLVTSLLGHPLLVQSRSE